MVKQGVHAVEVKLYTASKISENEPRNKSVGQGSAISGRQLGLRMIPEVMKGRE